MIGTHASREIAHVTKDNRHIERTELLVKVWISVHMDKQLQMPSQRSDALLQPKQRIDWQKGAGGFDVHEVNPDSLDTDRVHIPQFAVRFMATQNDNATSGIAKALKRLQERTVVGSIDARLDEHTAGQAQAFLKGPVVHQEAVRRRVDAFRDVRISGDRSKNMEVAIACVGRQRHTRCHQISQRSSASRRAIVS
jgi:hypothetical protein